MISKYYKCEFLSDIVLPASSNTQGNIKLSDFIPGSNFLGIVASNGGYDSFGQDSFDVFHSGAVCFGDANIVVDGKQSFKIPLSFHNLKVGDGCYNRLYLSTEEENKLREEQKQLKQIRTGFINEDLAFKTPSYNYSQKSKYSKKYRRSEDEGMYGYSALSCGTTWIFKIDFKDEKYIKSVEDKLLGKKRVGKSKSSQYGQVKISKINNLKNLKSFTPKDNLTYIYANSRIALFEEDGTFTAIPTIKNLGLEGGEIVWDKTFIKTSTYTLYNYTRQTKEYTRVCIDKGSVITIKNAKGNLSKKIGAFISEGFGNVLINPSFLEPKEPELKEFKDKKESVLPNGKYDTNLISFLKTKEKIEKAKFEVASHVQKTYKNLIGPSKSQWGEIRAIASTSKDKDKLISKIDKYISSGVAQKQWEGKKDKLFEEINKSKNPIEFTKLLSMIVSKHTKGGK